MRYLILALILALCLSVISPLSAAAQSLGEYFSINYQPVSLSEDEIQGSDVFYATVSGNATCTKDLPISVNAAIITSRVVAENMESGRMVTLNESYTLEIKPFPSKKGKSAEIEQVIQLQFPGTAEPGDYNIVGELIEAKVKVSIMLMPMDVTAFLPKKQVMGSVKYTVMETTPKPVPTPAPAPAPEQPPAPTSAPAPEQPLTPAPALEPEQPPAPLAASMPEYLIPWWVWPVIAIAAATTIFNVVWHLRHRDG